MADNDSMIARLVAWLGLERTRAYFYRIAIATVPLAVAGGLIDNDTAATVLLVIAAVLGIGAPVAATINTTTKPDDPG